MVLEPLSGKDVEPLQLQEQVDKEIQSLLERSHIEKVNTMKDVVFIQPVVTTVGKDRCVKIALEARANNSIARDKYHMPNLDNLMDMIAKKIDRKERQVWYSSVDKKYAYGQVPLDESTAEDCSFQTIGGKSTGTSRFTIGPCGLSIMQAEFQ